MKSIIRDDNNKWKSHKSQPLVSINLSPRTNDYLSIKLQAQGKWRSVEIYQQQIEITAFYSFIRLI